MKEVTYMERHIPKPGERYTDIRQKTYQILCVANYVRTKEKMVVYQGLYGEFEYFVRPLGMFMEEVDHKKYPDVLQKYYFELSDQTMRQEMPVIPPVESLPQKEPLDFKEADQMAGSESSEQEQANPSLIRFLDADTLEEKYQVVKALGGSITNRLIDDFAVTLDLVIPEGDIDFRYHQLLSSVRTLQKFESTRFRKR